jgi:hypothetical protein
MSQIVTREQTVIEARYRGSAPIPSDARVRSHWVDGRTSPSGWWCSHGRAGPRILVLRVDGRSDRRDMTSGTRSGRGEGALAVLYGAPQSPTTGGCPVILSNRFSSGLLPRG